MNANAISLAFWKGPYNDDDNYNYNDCDSNHENNFDKNIHNHNAKDNANENVKSTVSQGRSQPIITCNQDFFAWTLLSQP